MSISFRPDGKHITAVDNDAPVGTTRVWDVATGKLLHVLQTPGGDVVGSVAYSPNGNLLALAGRKDESGFIDLWDAATYQYKTSLKGHVGPIIRIAFGKNRWLASGGGENTLQLWDVQSQKVVRTMAFYREVQDVAFSSDGRWLAAQYIASPELWEASVWDLGQDSAK